MGYTGKDTKILGGSVPAGVADYVIARAVRLDKSKAWALGRIIDYWIAQGAPPLSAADAHLPHLPTPWGEELKAAEDQAPYSAKSNLAEIDASAKANAAALRKRKQRQRA